MSKKTKTAVEKEEEEKEEEMGGEEKEEDSSEDDDSDNGVSDLEDIQINFEASSISEEDYHGVKRLLQQVFPKAPVDISDIADYIVKQENLGSVIKICVEDDPLTNNESKKEEEEEEEEDVLGVTTVLLMSHFENIRDGIKQLSSFLLSLCKEHSSPTIYKDFNDILVDSKHRVAIVIHERFLNIPIEIGPPLLKCLRDEIRKHLKTKEPTHYVFITRSYEMSLPSFENRSGRKREREGKRKHTSEDVSQIVMEFQELEYLQKEMVLSFTYPIDSDTVYGGKWRFEDNPMIPHRTVFVIDKKCFNDSIDELPQIQY